MPASSIANVANRLLNVPIFQSFDMPLDVTPKNFEHLIHYMERQETRNGLVILFDMGSLKIYQYFPAEEEGPFLLMNNVTTSLALSIEKKPLKTKFLLKNCPKSVNGSSK